ncbi:unnamed protein product [Ectocarpus sp. 6 AP-2014]
MEANPTGQAVTSERQGSLSKRSKRKSSRSSQQVLMCIADCKYDVVRAAAQAKGWKLVNEDPEASSTRKCHVYWIDVPAIVERMQHLHRWQRINHFPGMSNVARKGRLAQNLDRMRRTFPHEYSFYPRTWVLPVEWGAFKTEFDAGGKSTRTFIVKPDSGCQGRGIFLTQDLERVEAAESQVAQLYVQRPLLIEGFKFDLRLYVLVTSVIPLRVYVFKDGLTRFCTEEYSRASSDNLGRRCMHLTNYAVNKGSDNFVANDQADLGSKRSLRWLLGWIAAERGGQEKAGALWRKMGGAITKTLVSVLPTLHREYLHTFGHDKGVHRPAATSATNTTANAASNTADAKTSASTRNVARSDSNRDCDARPPVGRIEAENTGSSSWDYDSYRAGDSIHDGNIVGQISGSEEQPPRQLREDEAASFFSNEAPGKDKTLKEVESTSPRSSRGAAGATGAVEKDSEAGGSGTRPGITEGGERCGGKQAQSYDISVDGDGKTVAGVNNRAHAGGEKGEGKTAGDSKGVVEGSRCVEILGFDFMIDAALKPWLIEVNHLPSFATDSPLDRKIKAQVVSAALSVLHAKADDRKRYEETAKRDAQNRLYNNDASAAGTAQREKERKEAEAAVAKIRRKLEAIYMRFAPHKLGKVDRLLVKYAGDENKLLRIVRRKYVDTGRENATSAAAASASASAAAAAAAEGPGSIPVSSGDSEVNGQQAVEHQPPPWASSPTRADTAPVHGGETIPLGEAARDGHRSRQVLVKSKANSTEGQTSALEERLVDGTKPKHGDVHSNTCPPDARILDPPRDPGGGVPGKEEGPAPASSSSSWAVQHDSEHDPEALARETEILEGWERLHPPPEALAPARAPVEEDYVVGPRKPSPPAAAAAKSNDGNGDGNDNGSSTVNDDAGQEESINGGDGFGGGGGGGVRNACGGGSKAGAAKGGRRRRKPAATVESMIRRAFEDDRKMTLRLKCPLQQQRGGAMDPQITTKLPQMGAQPTATATAAAATAAALTTATSDRQNNRPSPSVILGPEQREKAQRLMEGYSSNSRRSLSAPSGTTPSTATPPEEERSTLPVSLRIAVGRAKEWRRRRDEGNARRNTRSVAVRMHTFDFGEVTAPEEGVNKTA